MTIPQMQSSLEMRTVLCNAWVDRSASLERQSIDEEMDLKLAMHVCLSQTQL